MPPGCGDCGMSVRESGGRETGYLGFVEKGVAMLSRRALIGKAAVGAAAAMALGAARTGLASARAFPRATDDPAERSRDDRDRQNAVPRRPQAVSSPAEAVPSPADPVTTAEPPPWDLVH